MTKIGLIDYGSGNYKSVHNALEYLNVDFIRINHPNKMNEVSHLILPGVGAFGAAMNQLRKLGFIDTLQEEVVHSGKYFLGICVGMQVLATIGTEFEETIGLKFIPGEVVHINVKEFDLPVPHIGWNEVTLERNSPLFKDIEEESIFYFVHSFHFIPESPEHLVSSCQYGQPITASIEKDNIFGVQFHPEKSQLNGLQLLTNFVNL
jgi:imidazole glycerol-phosphate synthase subunit HisH